jgi:hypothetical protein
MRHHSLHRYPNLLKVLAGQRSPDAITLSILFMNSGENFCGADCDTIDLPVKSVNRPQLWPRSRYTSRQAAHLAGTQIRCQ